MRCMGCEDVVAGLTASGDGNDMQEITPDDLHPNIPCMCFPFQTRPSKLSGRAYALFAPELVTALSVVSYAYVD